MIKRIISLIICFVMVMATSVVFAEEEAEGKRYTMDEIYSMIETHGTDITPKNWVQLARTEGNGSGKPVEVTGQDFTEAYRVTCEKRGSNNWATQVWVDYDFTGLVKSGDTIMVTYRVKAIETFDETALVRLSVNFRPDGSSGSTKQVSASFAKPVSDEWIRTYGKKAATVSGTSKGAISMHVGQAPQTFEIADLKIINFGSNIKVSEFPEVETTWVGMEPDAQWRKDALERIEKIRKAELEVSVTDAGGNPISNAEVKIEQKKHSFEYGSLIPGTYFNSKNEQLREKVLNQFLEMFNYSGFENAMKGGVIAAQEDYIERGLTWMEENGITCRGHVLVWRTNDIRSDIRAEVLKDSESMKKYIREHIAEFADKYKGRIDTWDVANEQVTNPEIWKLTGKEDMVEWFKLTKQYDPYCKLALTDYGILGSDINHRDAHYDFIKYLIDNGAPIDVAGIQGHIGTSANPETALRALNKFAELGVDIEITEFTANIADPVRHGEFVRDMLIVFFSHPAVTSVLTWGYIEGSIKEKNAALVYSDFSLKPAGEVWLDLFKNQWWTKESGTSGSDGKFMTRAFHGQQEVTVTAGGKTGSVVVPVTHEGTKITAVVGGDVTFKEPTIFESRPEADKKTRVVPVAIANKTTTTNAPVKEEAPKEEAVVDNSYKGPFDIEFHWARENVERMIEKGVVNGYADGSFKPDNQINVDEFIKLTVAAKGNSVKNSPGYWGDSWIDKALEFGYIKKGDFDSYTRAITREEMAYIVSNAVGEIAEPEVKEDPVADSSAASDAVASSDAEVKEEKTLTDIESCLEKFKAGVKKVFGIGIITGYEDSSFRPKNNATRAEAAVIIERLMNTK